MKIHHWIFVSDETIEELLASDSKARAKFSSTRESFKRVIAIRVNWNISIWNFINASHRYPRQNTSENVPIYSGTVTIHTEKSFRNLIKSNRNQILFTIFQLSWNQKKVRLVPNQSENGKYNLILVWFNKISKRFLWFVR